LFDVQNAKVTVIWRASKVGNLQLIAENRALLCKYAATSGNFSLTPSVRNDQYWPRNKPEDSIYHLLRGGRLKART